MDKAIKFFGVCIVVAALIIGVATYLSTSLMIMNLNTISQSLVGTIQTNNQTEISADRYHFIDSFDADVFTAKIHVFDKQTGLYYVHNTFRVPNSVERISYTTAYDVLKGEVYSLSGE